MQQNDHLTLISGKSATGKSASLMGITDPSGVIYLNCENSKKLPFNGKFKKEFIITDPMQVYQAIEEVEKMEDVHTIVIDTLTFLMDMFETKYVLTASNGMKAWGNYAQYMKVLMAQHVAASTKNIIFLAHTFDVFNEAEMINETLVKVKGSLMNTGVESFFTNVISTKKMSLTSIKDTFSTSPLFNVTEEQELLGFKYVFQTKLTKETVNERIRSPIDMWKLNETFIDNNVQHVIDRLHEFYD